MLCFARSKGEFLQLLNAFISAHHRSVAGSKLIDKNQFKCVDAPEIDFLSIILKVWRPAAHFFFRNSLNSFFPCADTPSARRLPFPFAVIIKRLVSVLIWDTTRATKTDHHHQQYLFLSNLIFCCRLAVDTLNSTWIEIFFMPSSGIVNESEHIRNQRRKRGRKTHTHLLRRGTCPPGGTNWEYHRCFDHR